MTEPGPSHKRLVSDRNNIDHWIAGEAPGWAHCDAWLDEEREPSGTVCASCSYHAGFDL